MESRRKRSRGQIVKWICYALLGLLLNEQIREEDS